MTKCDRYASYCHLSMYETEGSDYRRVVRNVGGSCVAIVAPHGGGIEPGTSRISRAVAGDRFNLYLFEGIKSRGNRYLHVTSRNFDEPSCLALISKCDTVVTIHGLKGDEECILLGGLDSDLKHRLGSAFSEAGLAAATEGHRFPAVDEDNICNRGRSGRGVQLEISGALRRGRSAGVLTDVVRNVLALADAPAGRRDGETAR